MTGPVGNISRRAIITTAGGLAAASVLGAEASILAHSPSDAAATHIRRISLVAKDAASVADALQRFIGSTAQRTPSQVAQAGVHTECFWIGDTLVEISQPAAYGHEHASHLVGLDMPSPAIVRDRAQAAGLRLARDMTVRGHRLVQPDSAIPGVRLEASASLQAPARPDSAVSVTGLKIVADHSARTARQVAALFGGRAADSAISFGARSLEFAAPQANDTRRGLVEVALNAPKQAAKSARIAGVDWRILA